MRWVSLFLLLILGACQSVPQPFESSRAEKLANRLLDLPDADAGLAVLPTTGIAAGFAARLDAALAESFRGHEIPAWVQDEAPRRALYQVMGQARLSPHDRYYDRLDARYDMHGRDGRFLGGARMTAYVPHGLTQGPAQPQMRDLAARLADQLAPLVVKTTSAQGGGGQGPGRQGGGAPSLASAIHVGPVTGAPGDGAGVLAASIANELRLLGLGIADTPAPHAARLTGRVEMGARDGAGKQRVAIHWDLNQPDGTRIGSVDQANDVPAGSLDRAWGVVAVYITQAAAPGIKALFDQAPPMRR